MLADRDHRSLNALLKMSSEPDELYRGAKCVCSTTFRSDRSGSVPEDSSFHSNPSGVGASVDVATSQAAPPGQAGEHDLWSVVVTVTGRSMCFLNGHV